jgi:hypothetical protein
VRRKVREGGRRHKGVEKDILGGGIHSRGGEGFWGRTLSLGPGRDLCLGFTHWTGVARGFGLGGPGYP